MPERDRLLQGAEPSCCRASTACCQVVNPGHALTGRWRSAPSRTAQKKYSPVKPCATRSTPVGEDSWTHALGSQGTRATEALNYCLLIAQAQPV